MPSAAQTSSTVERSRALAATPPARHSARAPTSAAARRAFVTRTSTTACWNEAATSAVAASGCLRTCVDHRGLEPAEREVVPLAGQGPGEGEGRRVALARRSGRWPGRPGSRGRGTGPPCRRPRRRRRRWSGPGAGSGRARSPRPSRVWPPETSSTTSGQPRSGCSRSEAKRWASRWLTPDEGDAPGQRRAPWPRLTPTSSDPIRPGPRWRPRRRSRSRGVRPGRGQGLGQHRGEQLDVGPAGQLGDDPAVPGVQVDLAAHHRGRRSPTVRRPPTPPSRRTRSRCRGPEPRSGRPCPGH